MSSNAKRVPEINLEDFERRLRAAGSGQGAVEDPLEELTRLVNTIAAERTPAPEERVVDLPTTRATRAAPLARPKPAPEPEIEFEPPPPDPRPAAPFVASEASSPRAEAPLLRPSLEDDDAVEFGPAAEQITADAQDYEAHAGAPPAAPQRPKAGWYLKVGGLTAVGLVMVAGAAYLKLHGTTMGGLKSPPMIMAADGPSKVAPPDEKAMQSSSDSGALLTKDSTGSGQVKVVSNQEQPIDMGLKGDSPIALTKDTPIIPPSSGQPFVHAAPPPDANAAAPNPPTPPSATTHKGPKTVSVRPDGSLITADAQAAATAPAAVATPSPTPMAAKPSVSPSVTTQAASPTLDLPAKPTPAKTTARVNVAKTDTTAPTEPVSAPLQLGSAGADKPQKLPTKLRPPETQTADAQPAAAPAAASGDWAVQLAAPRSEADAQSAIQKLQTKYASALGDNELGVRKAEVNGDTIYRVRASGLSKASAQSLCQKLKSDGGDCFVAKN